MEQQRGRDTRIGPRILVFSCSGAFDVGILADRVVRRLTTQRTAAMGCAVAIAAGNPAALDKARQAEALLVLDGCDTSCVKTIFEKAGFANVIHLNLEELGFIKGKTLVTDSRVELIATAALERIQSVSHG